MRKRLAFAVLTGAAVSLTAFAPAKAAEEDYINRFQGQWSGSGNAKRPQDDSPWNISCNMSGNSASQTITIDGSCQAAIIVSRPFAANITYNPRTGVYSGVYTGARVGPAKIAGKRSGDAVVMTVTWPKPLHGDTKATLTIRNSGNGQMAITLIDNLQPGGPQEKTTDVTLRRS